MDGKYEFIWGPRSWEDGSYAHSMYADVEYEADNIEIEHFEDEPGYRFVSCTLIGRSMGAWGQIEIDQFEVNEEWTIDELKKEWNKELSNAADRMILDEGEFEGGEDDIFDGVFLR